VIFEMSPGNADFAYIVSDYHFMIMASDGAGNVNVEATDNGTGGYTVDTFEPGVRADFTKNPNYWKENSAHFDAVNLLSVVDPTARQSAMLNGDVDIADAIDPKTVALLGRVPTIDILETLILRKRLSSTKSLAIPVQSNCPSQTPPSRALLMQAS